MHHTTPVKGVFAENMLCNRKVTAARKCYMVVCCFYEGEVCAIRRYEVAANAAGTSYLQGGN